ncbi:MAG: nucleotidyltransferase domain-containing protein [Spirochaetes bacterium]|jgi:predicted nucleotidyltransferase|nr:nucleotidyltransferase domain-containing protein [Spirochaetota bacterium]
MLYGLSDEVIKKLITVFSKFRNIEKVIIYGSRAKDTFKAGSDIDLTLVGKQLTLSNCLYPVIDEIEVLLLPYIVDLSIYSQVNNPDLIEHIDRVGKIIYQRSE